MKIFASAKYSLATLFLVIDLKKLFNSGDEWMHFKIIFILTILLLYNCEHKKVDYRSGLLTIYFFQLVPILNRTSQCNKPNALLIDYSRDIQCIDSKVSDGLIFDSNTLSQVKTDTVIAGQSFFCQCGQSIAFSYWLRGITIDDNPQSNPSVTRIITTPRYSNPNQRVILTYGSNYNKPDNLYCVVECPIGSNSFQYQFLKIR